MLSILLLFLAILLSRIVTGIGAIALELTGMDSDHASFQATSAFSGTGYTTQEAEFALNHPQRRAIIQDLIRFGGAGIITTIATLVGALVSSPDIIKSITGGEDMFPWLPLNRAEVILIGIVMLVYQVYRLLGKPSIKRLIKEVVSQWLLDGHFVSPVQYREHVIQPNGYAVIQVDICDRNPMKGKTLAEIELKEKGVKVLSIERMNDITLLAPGAQTEIRLWDRVLLYGPVQAISVSCFAPYGASSQASQDQLEDAPLALGKPAPDFTLADQNNELFRLAALKGKRNLVIVFYPKDNSAVCSSQLHKFNSHLDELDALETDVIAINQGSLKTHLGFSKNLHLRYPLLTDPGAKVCKAYRCMMLGGLLVNRTVYVLDKDGVIRYAKRGNPDLFEVMGAIRIMTGLSSVSARPDDGMVCST